MVTVARTRANENSEFGRFGEGEERPRTETALFSILCVLFRESVMEPRANHDALPPADLLESTHTFPGPYTIKAIGRASDDFASRVVAAARAHLTAECELDHSVRSSSGGRRVAITLDLTIQTADQVLRIYAEIGQVEGLTLLI